MTNKCQGQLSCQNKRGNQSMYLRVQANCYRDQKQGPSPCKQWHEISCTENRKHFTPLLKLGIAPVKQLVLHAGPGERLLWNYVLRWSEKCLYWAIPHHPTTPMGDMQDYQQTNTVKTLLLPPLVTYSTSLKHFHAGVLSCWLK